MLDEGAYLYEIAEELCFDPTAVSREIRRNRIELDKVGKSSFRQIACARFATCTRHGMCNPKCHRNCRSCDWKRCEEVCDAFVEFSCTRPARYPHVCNSCKIKNRCPKQRYAYRAKPAHRQAIERASEAHLGLDLTPAEATRIAGIVEPLVRKGQSLRAILATHPELGMSPTTLYRYVSLGIIGVCYIDLPRAVRFKRRRRKSEARPQRRELAGRDFAAFCALPEVLQGRTIEMDTVIGRIGGKCLLTFCGREHAIFYARLMDHKTADCVRGSLDDIEMDWIDGMLVSEFGDIILLTDRGGEFDRFEDIERSCFEPESGEKRLDMYYCDPYRSWQKPHIENAHTLLRRTLPKGSSFDDLTQEQVNLVCSHINSYPREELGWKTPFEMLPEWGRENLPKALGMQAIARDDVNLTPSLIGR
jgi:IS30 family transposase